MAIQINSTRQNASGPVALSLLLIIQLVASGCSSNNPLRASPAERSGFIPSAVELGDDRERSPFHGVWYRDRDNFYEDVDVYTKLFFYPVRTDYLNERGWWSRLNSLDQDVYTKDVQELASHFDEALPEAFSEYEDSRWEIVKEPDEKTLVVEIAITEVVATKAHINAAADALGFLVPGTGLLKATSKGSVAMETNIYDGSTGELVVSFADRESDKITIVDLDDYQFYGHAKDAITTWSEQIAELAHTPPEHRVEEDLPVSLDPF